MNNFNFWCPVEITKAIDENTGEEIMLLGGIASTADEDSDGEFLDPRGFDINPLIKSGMVNWHHQAKTCPATIVGEPTLAEIRKDGLYIETKLYPSSPIARDIWELAKTLDKDSNTRRLGYSIEGKVLERKSDDKSSPDYKKITKAIITGVAITHQPKNPKTFANIIKGEIDNEIDDEEGNEETETKSSKKKKEEKEYYDGIGIKDKSFDTDNGRPLIKESVDPKLKVVTFGKGEVIEKLFKDIPGISIEKAKQIYNLIKNISNMAKRNVTEEDIQKAYDALGLTIPTDIQKGDDDEEEPTEENDEEEDDDFDDEDEENNDESDEDEDDEEEDDDETQKAENSERFNRIENAMAISHMSNVKYIKALGVMLKSQSNQLEKAIKTLNLAADKISNLEEINKAQSDEIAELKSQVEAFGNSTPAPKSLRHTAAVERSFAKGQENEFNEMPNDSKTFSASRQKSVVADILDQATFSKGYDADFSKACLDFEASGIISPLIQGRLKSEYGITIVQ